MSCFSGLYANLDKMLIFDALFYCTNLYFINVEDQLNYKILQMKLCIRFPKVRSQYLFKVGVLYITVHIPGSYKYSLVVRSPISDVRFFLK